MKIENELPSRARAALYIRVSTEEQALHGLSIEAQTEALDDWAEKNHVQVVGHYTDAGISARKPAAKRPELQRLLRDVQKGKVDQIVFTKLDRWFRNIAEYYKVQEVLEKHHVDWRTIHEDYDTSTASGRLKINIMLSVAQDEADRTSERIKAVFVSKRAKNEPLGNAPFGYRRENKQLVIVEEDAEIVRWIFNQYITLRSRRAVILALIEKYGITRTIGGMNVLLSNPKYIGQMNEQDGCCPPIVDRNTFDLVQCILPQRAQRNSAEPARVYLFNGLAFCAECNCRLTGQTVRGKYIYYYCNGYHHRRACMHNHRTSERRLERWMLENVLLAANQYNLDLEARRQEERPVIDESAIKRKMDKLKDLYLNDLIEREAYERDYTVLREKLRAAREAEEDMSEPIDIGHLRDALSVYQDLSREAKKEFWTRTIAKIYITNDDNFSFTLFSS